MSEQLEPCEVIYSDCSNKRITTACVVNRSNYKYDQVIYNVVMELISWHSDFVALQSIMNRNTKEYIFKME